MIRPLLPLLAALGLVLPALAEEVDVSFAAGLSVEALMQQSARTTGGVYLYVAEELKGRTLGGPFKLRIPAEKYDHLVRFLLGLRNIEARAHAGFLPTTVILPGSATATGYRAAGLQTAIEFDRPPTAWRRSGDAAGSLSKATTEELTKLLRAKAGGARRTASVLLGLCAPRTPEVVDALTEALEATDPTLRLAAAEALGRCGYFARETLPALRKLAEAGAAGQAQEALLEEAIRAIESAVSPALLDPRKAKEQAPEKFRVLFETTKGDFEVEVTRAWSPHGADRFFNLVRIGYFHDIAFFRVVAGFVAQFGVHGKAPVNAVWRRANIRDDAVRESNRKATLTFASTGRAHSRSVQFFINLDDNTKLDTMGFSPFGKVVKGMEVVEKLHADYGDGPPDGRGPDQQRLQFEGNEYLRKFYPELDYIKRVKLVLDK